MRIGLFGGQFDPVHCGHLILAEWVKNEKQLDKILFIPAKLHPIKNRSYVDVRDRLNMLKLAIADNDNFEICDWELYQDNVNYTFYTVQHLQQQYKSDELFMIIGMDNAVNFDKWQYTKELNEMVKFFVLKRITDNNKISNMLTNYLEIQTPIIEISSTMIRTFISNKRSIRYLVPYEVEKYIREKKLYE